MRYFIYILYSLKSFIYYIGHSKDVEGRIKLHNSNDYKSFTTKHKPWELKLKLEVGDKRGIAIKIEKYLKKQKSRKFVEEFIASEQIQKEIIERFQKEKLS